jgi:hypothetical protein
MKKGILIGTLVLAVISSSFAGINKNMPGHDVLSSFRQEFTNAHIIKWEQVRDVIKVTFSQDNHIMFAYFNESDELLAVSRNILSDQLPVRLIKSLHKNYNGYWITDLFQMNVNGETSYFVRLESSEYNLVLTSGNMSSWQVYRRDKKSVE